MYQSRIQLIVEHLTLIILIAVGIALLLGVVPGSAGQTKLRIIAGIFAVLWGAGRLVMVRRRMRRQETEEDRQDWGTR